LYTKKAIIYINKFWFNMHRHKTGQIALLRPNQVVMAMATLHQFLT